MLSEKDKPEITQITPLYILTTLEIWINEGILKPTSSTGYILTDFNINLPSDKDLDKYYHDIFHTLDSRWIRLLESAAVLGFKFNARTLADLWSYKLLDVLIFLEKAQDLGLVKDLSSEDNFYEFTNSFSLEENLKKYYLIRFY